MFVYIFTVIEEPFIKRVQLTSLNLPHFYACLKPFLCSMIGGGSWLFVLIILVELFRRSYHIGGTVQMFLSYWWNCSDFLFITGSCLVLCFQIEIKDDEFFTNTKNIMYSSSVKNIKELREPVDKSK